MLRVYRGLVCRSGTLHTCLSVCLYCYHVRLHSASRGMVQCTLPPSRASRPETLLTPLTVCECGLLGCGCHTYSSCIVDMLPALAQAGHSRATLESTPDSTAQGCVTGCDQLDVIPAARVPAACSLFLLSSWWWCLSFHHPVMIMSPDMSYAHACTSPRVPSLGRSQGAAV